jgi:hypothetical protein
MPPGRAKLSVNEVPGKERFVFVAPRPGSSVVTQFFVWPNEIRWFLRSLRALSDHIDVKRFLAAPEGRYPLLSDLRANGGIAWFAVRRGSSVELRIVRYDYRYKKGGASQFARYCVPDWKFCLSFPLDRSTLEEFSAIAAHWGDWVDAKARCIAERLGAAHASLAPQEVWDRVLAPARRGAGCEPIQPGVAATGATSVLQAGLFATVFEACATPRAASEIPTIVHAPLSSPICQRLLVWTTRYSAEALAGGYLVSFPDPVSEGPDSRQARMMAIRDGTVFAADPLFLTYAQATPKPGQALGPSLIAPACTASMMEAAVKKRLTGGSLETSFGRAVTPSAEFAETIAALVSSAGIPARQRWKALQLMTLRTAGFANLPQGCDHGVVLEAERSALLIRDASLLFADDPEGKVVVDEARVVFAQTLESGPGAVQEIRLPISRGD